MTIGGTCTGTQKKQVSFALPFDINSLKETVMGRTKPCNLRSFSLVVSIPSLDCSKRCPALQVKIYKNIKIKSIRLHLDKRSHVT